MVVYMATRQLNLLSEIDEDELQTLKRKIHKNGPQSARIQLETKYANRLCANTDLNRQLVSFQKNKKHPFNRWFKYKEGFSAQFVQYILDDFAKACKIERIHLLDPFAGAGTALMQASLRGWSATGIELLPPSVAAIQARVQAQDVDLDSFYAALSELKRCIRTLPSTQYQFPHLYISQKAFPAETERALSAYQGFLGTISSKDVKSLFHFACLSVLEEISYTRKDGQYLRWDARAGKNRTSTFHKGPVLEFKAAILRKLEVMAEDLAERENQRLQGRVRIIEGSCLTQLAQIPANTFDVVVTSPPYCNRYDYTRTYALELAYLGFTEDHVKKLRQTLLSATVENRSKRNELKSFYDGQNPSYFDWVSSAFENQEALQEVLSALYRAKEQGLLNNNNIPGMVSHYFFEMNVVIHELARVLASKGRVYMVNDNVQYIGEHVPVDLILSEFAAHAGLTVDKIWVLPRGKGNSSQQMDQHGRNELRKCVYVWSKPASK